MNLQHRIDLLKLSGHSPRLARWVAETEHAIKYGLAKDWNAANHKRAKKAKNGAPKEKETKVKKPEANGHKEKPPQTKQTGPTKAATAKAERGKHKAEKQAKNSAPSGEPKACGGFAAAGVDLTAPGSEAERPPAKPPTAGPEGGTDLGREETGGQDPGGAGPPV